MYYVLQKEMHFNEDIFKGDKGIWKFCLKGFFKDYTFTSRLM